MASQSALSQTQEERLQEILAAYLRDVEAGRNPDQPEILARHPDLAGELQDFFAGQEQLGRLAAPLRQAIEPSAGAGITGTLGDFRIVREVGRGGMGIVYEAEQISLRRRVALKVLPFAATMDPRHLQRFHNEAQAAACLHHTNIVPVHFVGSERGVHFYAMQFIDGQPLSETIRQLRRLEKKAPATEEARTVAYQPAPDEVASTPVPAAEITPLTGEGRRSRDYFRKVAELGVQAAEALDHAHQLGIVHRDIKPANLLLDDRGNLWVTDFGLAHMQHGEASLTGTGQMMGTPRYMSPEQALAKRVPIDHRTDVYSLGATLYELLTLRPAFVSEDRQELLRQIAFEEPTKPRRLERTIPAELETIVLKAMEKRPQDRYATAQELADDLRHWLEDRPIRARRPTWVQVTRKWMRRHQAIVWSVAVCTLLIVAVVGANIGWLAARRANAADSFDQAVRQAIDFMQHEKWPEAKAAAQHAAGLLAGAGGDWEQHQRLEQLETDLNMAGTLELIRLQNAQAKDGHIDEGRADSLLEAAFRAYNLPVLDLQPEEAARRIAASDIREQLLAALMYWTYIKAEPVKAKKLVTLLRLADESPWRQHVWDVLDLNDGSKTVTVRLTRAEFLRLLQSEEALGRPPAELDVFGSILARIEKPEAIKFLRRAQQRHPDDLWINEGLAYALLTMEPPQLEEAIGFYRAAVALRPQNPAVHLSLALALQKKGRLDEAIAGCRGAIRLNPDYALGHSQLGHALRDKGQLDEAIAEHREALRLKKDYADAHIGLGIDLLDKGRLDEAIAEFREAIRLERDEPYAHNGLGAALKAKGRLNEAIAEYREAIRIKNDNVYAHCNLGQVLRDKGLLNEAIAEYQEAIRIKKDLADAHYGFGQALLDKGLPDEAIAKFHEAIRLKKDFAYAHNNLGIALCDKGRWDDAIAEYREAIRLKKDYANAHSNLGNALRHKGRLDEAITQYREAIRINKDDAGAHHNLAVALHDKGQLDEAITESREAVRLEKDSAVMYKNLKTNLIQREALAKLPSILSGKAKADNAAERIALAQVCQEPFKRLYAAAVQFYLDAFAAQPSLADDLDGDHRYNAACAAALAGCGQGKDAEKVDAKERARLRQQALDWLRDDLKAYRQVLEKSAGKAGPAIAQRMQHWLRDGDLAGVRGEEALAKLPAEERAAWRKLWADVAEMLAKAQGKAPAERKPDAKSPPRNHKGA